MRFIANTTVFLAGCFGIMVPLFVGYALSSHHNEWYGYAAVALVVCAALFFAYTRIAPRAPVPTHH